MLETIASINEFAEEAGVTEVCGPGLAWFQISNRVTIQ